jgi:DMSO/TMAO reductase YedYZ molybdopterin-dependent catalytic subunit
MTEDDRAGIVPSKLTLSKERWAKEGRLPVRSADRPVTARLPAGQHTVRNWPVLDLGVQPEVTRESWRLQLFGAVENPLILDWAALERLPRVQCTSDIHCVTSWSRYDNRWSGVRTRDLIDAIRPRADARYVLAHSYDNYTTNITLDDFASEAALLAMSWSEEPLTTEHGGPARLVIPHLYFWKSAKWIRALEFRSNDAPGYWEMRGYHNRGDPWNEERYSSD